MANEQNLVPLKNTNDSQEQSKRGAKGGSVISPKKKFAAKIREMKKRQLSDEDVNWFLERIEDPEVNMFHLQRWLDQLRDNIPIERQRTLLDTAINLHKAHHGEKIKSENKNINVNLNIDMLKFNDLVKKYSEN